MHVFYDLRALEPADPGNDPWTRQARLVVAPAGTEDEPALSVWVEECAPGGGWPQLREGAEWAIVPMGHDYRKLVSDHAFQRVLEGWPDLGSDDRWDRLHRWAQDEAHYLPDVWTAEDWLFGAGEGYLPVVSEVVERGSIRAFAESCDVADLDSEGPCEAIVAGGREAIEGEMESAVRRLIHDLEVELEDMSDPTAHLLALAALRRLIA
jgi:hypothetical protein